MANIAVNFLKIVDSKKENALNFINEFKKIGKTETSDQLACLNKDTDSYIYDVSIPDDFNYESDVIIFLTKMDDVFDGLMVMAKQFNVSLIYELCEFGNCIVESYYINNNGNMLHFQLDDEDFEYDTEFDENNEQYQTLSEPEEGFEDHYLDILSNKKNNYYLNYGVSEILEKKGMEKLKGFIQRNGYITSSLNGNILTYIFENPNTLDEDNMFWENEDFIKINIDLLYITVEINLDRLFTY